MKDLALLPITTDADFHSVVLSRPGVTVVECWAVWMPQSRLLEPIIHEVARLVPNGVAVVRLDTDEAAYTAARYGIRDIPAVLFIRDGVALESMAGVPSAETILGAVARCIAAAAV